MPCREGALSFPREKVYTAADNISAERYLLLIEEITERSEGYERGGACRSSSDEVLYSDGTVRAMAPCGEDVRAGAKAEKQKQKPKPPTTAG